MRNINESKVGMIYGISTFIMWGLFPIYFKMLNSISSIEILAHRMFWACIFSFLFLILVGKFENLKRYILNKKIFINLTLGGIFVSLNWEICIYAVNTDRILEASLGYFINPLMYILLGALFFKEIPSAIGKIAIFIVFIAIVIQIINLGKLPFISLLLPTLFAIYGFIKKRLLVSSLESLFIETFLLSIIAFIYILFLQSTGAGNLSFDKIGILLVFSGVVTILPLLTFNSAAIRLKFSTMGFLQYISPTITTCLAIFVYNEEFNIYKFLSFMLIWFSIALVTFDEYKRK